MYECTLITFFPITLMITTLPTSSLVIDFSDMQHTDKHPFLDSEIRNLIHFIQSHPDRAAIHVYVRSGIVSAANRKLQSRLQTLGCKVTTKIAL